MLIVVAAVVVAVWELRAGLRGQGHRDPRAAADGRRRRDGGRRVLLRRPGAGHRHRGHRAGHHAVAAARRGRRLRHGRHRVGVHARLRAVPRRRSSRCCWPRAERGLRALGRRGQGIVTFIVVTIASDIGGYVAGVLVRQAPDGAGDLAEEVVGGLRRLGRLLRRRRLADWSSTCSTATGGSASLLGLIAVVMATLGDLCESVIKRDLGIKDMSPDHPRPRRPDGPARLAARHRRADLAAAALPGLLSGRRDPLPGAARPAAGRPASRPAPWGLDPAASTTSGRFGPRLPTEPLVLLAGAQGARHRRSCSPTAGAGRRRPARAGPRQHRLDRGLRPAPCAVPSPTPTVRRTPGGSRWPTAEPG